MTIGTESQLANSSVGLRSRIVELLHRRTTWVMLDQGIVSAGSFLTANLLGRQLSAEHFGVFGLVFETMLYLNSLQSALVIYPLTMKSATGERENLGRLATYALAFTLMLLPVLGLATGGAVVAAGEGGIAIAAITAMFLWQIQETLRRALIADLRVADTVLGDAVRYIGQATLIAIMWQLGLVTLNTTFAVIGFTSAIAIAIQARQVGLARIRLKELPGVAREFWQLGRWMFPAYASGLVTSLGFWWTLNWTHGAVDCGIFNAVFNVFKPANPVMSSLSGLVVPVVARSLSTEGAAAANRSALRHIKFGAVILAPYYVLVILFPQTTMGLFYGWKSPYLNHAVLLQLYVGNYSLAYIQTMVGAWLAGLGHTRWNFIIQSVQIFGTLLIGLPMTWHWGVSGLIIGGLIASGCGAVASAFFVWRASSLARVKA